MVKIGGRVGAVLSSEKGKVKFFGYGVYIGDEIPPEEAGGGGQALNEIQMKNPCILLDSGKKVFGCECWWGSEETIKKDLEGREIIMVDIDEERKKWNNG